MRKKPRLSKRALITEEGHPSGISSGIEIATENIYDTVSRGGYEINSQTQNKRQKSFTNSQTSTYKIPLEELDAESDSLSCDQNVFHSEIRASIPTLNEGTSNQMNGGQAFYQKKRQKPYLPVTDTNITAMAASAARAQGTYRGRGFPFGHRGGGGRHGGRGRGFNSSGGSFSGSSPSHGSGRGSQHGGGRGPGSAGVLGPLPSPTNQSQFSGGSSGRVQCQICGRSGHSALDCYNRMNMAYEGRVPTSRLTSMVAATHGSPSTLGWLTDTGANSHITQDMSHLQAPKEYRGADNVNGVLGGTSLGFGDGEDPFPRAE